MKPALTALFQYKAWANQELLAALAAFDAARHPARFQAMLDILGHANVVDRIFRKHLGGSAVETFASTEPERPPTLPELRAAVDATDAWYLGFLADVDAARLREPVPFVFTDGNPGTMTREEMLLHVATHAGYHRGSIGQILEDLGLASPPDSLTKFLHRQEPARRIHGAQDRQANAATTRETSLFDHVVIGVSDYAASKAFFLQALAPLGVASLSEGPLGIEMCAPGSDASFCLFQTDEKPARLHLAFAAGTRQQVDAFHAAALAAGGQDNGAPGLRPKYNATYYAAFVIGPDGHNVEAVCHQPEA